MYKSNYQMESIFETAKAYAAARLEYETAYSKKQSEEITSDKSNKESVYFNDDGSLLTVNSIDLFGSTISAEFMELCNNSETRNECEFEPKFRSRRSSSIRKPCLNFNYTIESSDVPESDLDKKNIGLLCQNQYVDCINKIRSFGIGIISIRKRLSNYSGRRNRNNRAWNICNGTFEFKCVKNSWKFDLEFYDDSQYDPGMMLVQNLTNGTHGADNISISCDLYAQNTALINLTDFLFLLDCTSLDDYREKRFGYLLGLPTLLQKAGFTVQADNFMTDKSVSVTNRCNNHNFIKIDDFAYITLLTAESGDKIILKIISTDEFVNADVYIMRNRHVTDKSFTIDYDSAEDFPTVYRWLINYNNYLLGNYGINNTQNDLIIKTYFDTIPGICHINSSTYHPDGTSFTSRVIIKPEQEHDALSKNRVTDCPYPYDIYEIKMSFDPKVNLSMCTSTVKLCCRNLTEIARK